MAELTLALAQQVYAAILQAQKDIDVVDKEIKVRIPGAYPQGHPGLATASGDLNKSRDALEVFIKANGGSAAPPPSSTAPVPTFTASVSGSGNVTTTWANVVPVKLARDGKDSTGGGVWDTGQLLNEPSSGSFQFTLLLPNTKYNFTLTQANGSTLTASITTPAASAPPVTTPPVTTPPVTTPPVITSAPVPSVAAFADYVIAPGGDFEFAQMPTTALGVAPAGWIFSPTSQIAGGTAGQSVPEDVQNINGQGLVLLTSNGHSPFDGGSIQTPTNGFQVSGKFFRELGVILPALVNGVPPNQVGLWMLTRSNNGEIDIYITGWDNASPNLETGNQSQYPGHGPAFKDASGKYPTGYHTFGASWDDEAPDAVQYYMDGKAYGSPVAWPAGHAPDTNSPWFLILTNQGAGSNGQNGPNGANGPTVYGDAGKVIVVWDRTFLPKAA